MAKHFWPSGDFGSDPYFKKDVKYQYRGRTLNFRVSQELFSSQDIDVGTKRLLKTLTDEGFENYQKVLDFGCGYGPIAIALKSACPSSEIHGVDKDALALDYANQNAKINNISDIKIYPSLGYDNVLDDDFDLIVSNIPGKVGNRVLSHILKDARFHLKPQGRVAIVVIDAIGNYVTEVLSDPGIKILFRKRWPGHLVFHYQFQSSTPSLTESGSKSFAAGIYARSENVVPFENHRLSIKTTYNLPEFDTLSYDTELLLGRLKTVMGRRIERAIIFNPGQGYIPVALTKLTQVREISLIDRDLQALKVSRVNLIDNGYPSNRIRLSHQVGISVERSLPADFISGILPEKDNPAVHAMLVRQSAARLAKEGMIILASSSTAITRVAAKINSEKFLNIVDRQKSKGRSVIILKTRA